MKSQNGVTLISLTIYVISMVIIVSIVAIISGYFYNNIDVVSNKVDSITEYTNFNSFFTNEVNSNQIKVLECKENYIVFDNQIQYMYIPENKGIYRNQVKIAKEVNNCVFEYKMLNGKKVINVTMQIGSDTEKNVQYTLKN